MSNKAKPAWMQNTSAFEAIAAQTMSAVAPPAVVEPEQVPMAAAVQVALGATTSLAGGREISLDDAGRRYVLHVSDDTQREAGRVVVGALTIGGPSVRTLGLRMPNPLLGRIDARLRGARPAGTTALLVYALDRLTEARLDLVYDDGAVRTVPGTGRIDSGAAQITNAGSKKLAQGYPGALVDLIDSRRDGPWPATIVALLTYALDSFDEEPCELRLRVEQAAR